MSSWDGRDLLAGPGLEVDVPGGAAPGAPDPVVGGTLAKIGDVAATAGIRSVDMIAWRDAGHPEAGGSELHAASIAQRWAAAGIEVRLIASRADGAPRQTAGSGYRVDRPAGRYGIFPTVAWHRPLRGRPPADATVEIWNGMPFFSPLWARQPRLVFLHHIHDGMWDLVLPRAMAAAGRFLECRVAPPFYRRTPVVTLSASSRRDIIERLGLHPSRVHVLEPGVEESYRPGPHRQPRPLVVAVGRLVPYKRFGHLIEVLVGLKRRVPDLEAVIAGEGQERAALEALVRTHGAEEWLTLPGRVGDEHLLDLYQRAWLLASASAFEGWGLTITEAAACATPAVASPIAGHADAVEDGVTGFLAEPGPDMEDRMARILLDPLLRKRMQRSARARAGLLSWDRTALGAMKILAGPSNRGLPRV